MTAFPRAQRRARKTAAKKRVDERKLLVQRTIDRATLESVVFVTGYALPSRANERLHRMTAATLTARQRSLGQRVGGMLLAAGLILPCTITLKRVGIRKLDGHDNLARAFKAPVDGIADVLVGKPRTVKRKGREVVVIVGDDSDPRITWVYEQETGKTPGIEARWSR